MISGTLIAQENADVGGAPFWVLAATVEAGLDIGKSWSDKSTIPLKSLTSFDKKRCLTRI